MTILRDDAADAVRGIGFVNAAYFAMTLGDLAAKLALPAFGVATLMVGRGVIGSVAILGLAMLQGGIGWRQVMPRRWAMVLLRAFLSCFVSLTWFAAWRTMSLADTYAIGFTAPLIMTLLAIPLLGEAVRWRRIFSTLVGFGGVLIMLRPDGDLWQPAVPFLLLGIVCMALARIMTRQLAATETASCQAFWVTLVHIPFGLALQGLYPAPPGAPWLLAMLALAFFATVNSMGHWIFARGYALAPISALAPYEYTMLIWGGVFGFLLFGDIPAWSTLAGAAIVAASGLYNLHRERVRRLEPTLV